MNATTTQSKRHLFHYGVMMGGQLLSLFGSHMVTFSFAVWVFTLTGSVVQMALLSVFAILPTVLISPVAGVIADRAPKKKTLIIVDSTLAVISLVVLYLSMNDLLQPWHLYISAIFSGLASGLQRPLFESITPVMVPEDKLVQVNGVVQTVAGISQLLSPALAGALVLSIGLSKVLLLDLATFVIAMMTLVFVAIPELEERTTEPNTWWQDLSTGLRYVLKRKGLRAMFLFVTARNFAFAVCEVLALPLLLTLTTAKTAGLVLSLSGLGIVVGGVLMAVTGGFRRKIDSVFLAQTLTALAMIMAALTTNLWLLGIAVALAFVAFPVEESTSTTIMQTGVPKDMMGRVSSVRQMLTLSSVPIAMLISAPLAEYVFEPWLANTEGGLHSLASMVVGVGEGRGMAIMLLLMGVLLLLITFIGRSYKPLVNIERDLAKEARFWSDDNTVDDSDVSADEDQKTRHTKIRITIEKPQFKPLEEGDHDLARAYALQSAETTPAHFAQTHEEASGSTDAPSSHEERAAPSRNKAVDSILARRFRKKSATPSSATPPREEAVDSIQAKQRHKENLNPAHAAQSFLAEEPEAVPVTREASSAKTRAQKKSQRSIAKKQTATATPRKTSNTANVTNNKSKTKTPFQFMRFISERPYLISLALFLLVAAWMFSPNPSAVAEHEDDTQVAHATHVQKVRVEKITTEATGLELEFTGQTHAHQSAKVSSELDGLLVNFEAKRGVEVKEGDVLAKLSAGYLEVALAGATAEHARAELDYKAQQRLVEQGIATEHGKATSFATLQAAKAQVAQIEQELSKTVLLAPFSGLVAEHNVEVGDFVGIGQPLLSLINLDPIVAIGHVSERDIHHLKVGNTAAISVLNGDSVEGDITYISPVANDTTRTFKVEVTVPNEDKSITVGMTTQISVPMESANANKISPALLTLNAEGAIQVASVDEDSRVALHTVEIVRSESDGIWVSGLPEGVRLITLGQGFVHDGDIVEAVEASEVGEASEASAQEVVEQSDTPVQPSEVQPGEAQPDVPQPSADKETSLEQESDSVKADKV